MSAGDEMARYLERIGMAHPRDAVQQWQLTLLRQWIDHLDAVLDAEVGIVGPDLRRRVIRAMIYGGVPGAGEAELRAEMTEQMTDMLQRTVIPKRTFGTGGAR